jgi:hypothetical protein
MIAIHFVVEDVPEGGSLARAIGADTFTEARDQNARHAQLRDVKRCHFDPVERCSLIHLHIIREEVIAA